MQQIKKQKECVSQQLETDISTIQTVIEQKIDLSNIDVSSQLRYIISEIGIIERVDNLLRR